MKLKTLALPLLSSLLALGFAAFATLQLDQNYKARLNAHFTTQAEQARAQLQSQLSHTAQLLHSAQIQHAVGSNAQPLDFIAHLLEKNAPAGLRSVSLAPLIQPEQLEEFIAQQRQQQNPDFSLSPGGSRPLYAPITRSVGNSQALARERGRDLFADPDQQKSLTLARDSGMPTLSGRVLLKNASGDFQPGFIVAAPIFVAGDEPANVAERRARIQAWLVASFTAQEWLNETLGPLAQNFEIQLMAAGGSADSRLYPASESAASADSSLLSRQTLNLGEQRWELSIAARPDLITRFGGNPAKPVGLLGIILAAALFYLSMVLSANRRRAEAEVERLHDALQEAEERWRFALEGSGDGVWDWDINTGKVNFSPRCDAILGVADGNAAKAVIHPEDEARERSAMQACLDGKSSQYLSEHRMQSNDGSWRWIAARGMVVARTFTGTAARMIGTMSDITERKTASDRIQDMAQLDAQTGLPNRTLFFDRLQQALRMAKRKRETLALICIDIDNFKGVNDNFGQAVGNKLLREVAERLHHAVRDSDTAAHFSEDDFVILLPTLARDDDAHLVTDKIQQAMNEDFNISNRHIHISVSIGAALFPQHARSAETLLSAAQRARQQAYKSGGNTICFSLSNSKAES